MATGYTLTRTGNTTKVVHITDDVVDKVDGFTGPVHVENINSTTWQVTAGSGVSLSFTTASLLSIDGEAPAGTLSGLMDQLIAVFPDASSGSASGGSAEELVGADWDGSKAYQTLEVADTDFVLDDATTFADGILYLIQDATGSRTASIKFGTGGTVEELDLNTAAGSITAVIFTVIGGLCYFTTDKTLTELEAGGAGYDADAETYFTAAGISDTPTKDAVNDVVVGLKAISLTVGGTAWSKAKIVAPLAGPDIAAQKVNAKTPGTHDFVTNGGMSYDADGFVYDGVDDYADASFVPITHLASATSDFTIAHGQATAPAILDKCAWGTTGDGSVYFYPKLTGGDVDYTGYSADLTFTPAATVGRYLMTWNDATTLRMYRNGTQVKTNTITPQGAHSTYKIYFGANGSANTATAFSDGRHSFYYIADARMTAAEAAAVDALFAAYETAMGR